MTALSVISILAGLILIALGYLAVYKCRVIIYVRKQNGELRDISQQSGSDLILMGIIGVLGGTAALTIPKVAEGILLYVAVIVVILCLATLLNINR